MTILLLLCLLASLLLVNAGIMDKIKDYMEKVKEIKAKTKSTSATSGEAAPLSHVPVIDIGKLLQRDQRRRKSKSQCK